MEESPTLPSAAAPQQLGHPRTDVTELPEIHASLVYGGGQVAITLRGDIAIYGGTSKIHMELIRFWRMILSSYFI